ncbi:MAG: HEPN domain-containing protein [Candidatus Aegiribacteria sp.]|nr:HEPN domain-containing protein [Candidatus Aegiribacteria sp.]
MVNKDIAVEWFKIAEADLASANYLQNMKPVPVEIICYHCQQSAEKFLKGYLAFLGEEILKTHDLVHLNKYCLKHDEEFSILVNDCEMINDYAVTARYPFPVDIDKSDMSLALQGSSRIKQFVLSKVE